MKYEHYINSKIYMSNISHWFGHIPSIHLATYSTQQRVPTLSSASVQPITHSSAKHIYTFRSLGIKPQADVSLRGPTNRLSDRQQCQLHQMYLTFISKLIYQDRMNIIIQLLNMHRQLLPQNQRCSSPIGHHKQKKNFLMV